VFDTPARVIELGERERFFTGGLRRAIEVRDRHCSHPGCYVPANHCEVDHIVEWAKGGETTQSNGRLLCPVHNRRRNTPIPLGSIPDGPSP
jgi:Rieske Fe-S protein